jgi:hypothetical protein
MNKASNKSGTHVVGTVKGNVGEVAVATVELIRRGVAVHRVGDVCGDLTPSEQAKWFVSVSDGSPLADTVFDIPLASSESEAWEFAIMFLATHRQISADLRDGLKTHRRTLGRLWRDIRLHASYSVSCEMQASEHYGYSLSAWDRVICWLDGAATGFFNDDCWMPITWRLLGRTPAEWMANWHASLQSTGDNVESSTGLHEEPAAR